MNTIATSFLFAGLIFPVISFLTGILSLLDRIRGRHSSPVFIPFIGPVLLSCWVLFSHKSYWFLFAVWVIDIGTLNFIVILPRLIREWWRISSCTMIFKLCGEKNGQQATISIHSTGHYLLKKTWTRQKNELGIINLGEPGTYIQTNGGYILTAYHGLQHELLNTAEGHYCVTEKQPIAETLRNYSLDGWILRKA